MMEFEIGDTVTVDRYNHIDDMSMGVVVDLVPFSTFDHKPNAYAIVINRCRIVCKGGSIVESKYYNPLPQNERNEQIKSCINEPYPT